MQRPRKPVHGRLRKTLVLQVEIQSGLTILAEAQTVVWSGTAASYLRALYTQARLLSETPPTFSLRKEVIQPQVLLRLPCYDFTPIMDHTLGRCSPCGSACRLLVQSTFVM